MKRSMLIVEDESGIMKSYERYFSDNWVIYPVKSVEAALGVLENFKIDFVLSDWNLICENAEPVIKKVEEMKLPYLVCTGTLDTLNVKNLITKGHLMSEIEERIEYIINKQSLSGKYTYQ